MPRRGLAVALALVVAVLGLVSGSSVGALPAGPNVAPLVAHVAPTWTNVTSAGSAPPARYGAAMAYDAKDGYVVLFGGANTSGALGDTWTYHAGLWTRINTTVSPSPRAWAVATWDTSDGYLVLFGGCALPSTGACSFPSSGGIGLNDTWKFLHGKWTLLSPSVAPPGRAFAAAAYDAALSEVVIGGGWNGGNLTDMWGYHAGSWSSIPVNASQPFRGRYASLGYLPSAAELVYFGGQGFSTNSTWTYRAGTWSHLSLSRAPPTGSDDALAFDPALKTLVLFGGNDAPSVGGSQNSTWGFTSGVWSVHPATVHPSARGAGMMAFDAKDGYLVLFGGFTNAGASLGDTWVFH